MVGDEDFVAIVGLGQLGRVFAGAFLAGGLGVLPVLRGMDMTARARAFSHPRLVLVATGEDELAPVLAALPEPWRERVGLLQNELLPRDWERHGIQDPTVMSVWFEKKVGTDAKPLLPSPVYGPAAELVATALEKIGIPTRRIDDPDTLAFELVRKNIYILTTNIAGMRVGGTVGELWERHQDLVEAVMDEILAVQEALTGGRFIRSALLAGLEEAIRADPAHQCMGRSASLRLERALAHADSYGIATPTLRAIAPRVGAAL